MGVIQQKPSQMMLNSALWCVVFLFIVTSLCVFRLYKGFFSPVYNFDFAVPLQ